MKIAKVGVHDFQIHAFHGIHEVEKKMGCMFSVDLDVEFQVEDHIEKLNESVDYQVLLNIVRKQMHVTRDILETVCQSIFDEISEHYKIIRKIEITIKKLDPPIENFKGYLSVNMIQIL